MSVQLQAQFSGSFVDYKACPAPVIPEYAFIGRSNVGKSSLVNMLVGQNKLAKVSATPGKTQTINHFLIDHAWYLVDLPGFGWAKVNRSKKEQFQLMTRDYICFRPNLICTFLLVDLRLSPQQIDLDFMEWLATENCPFVMVFTKADKLSQTKAMLHLEAYQQKMLESWEEMPNFLITSSQNKQGREELLQYIAQLNTTFVKPKLTK